MQQTQNQVSIYENLVKFYNIIGNIKMMEKMPVYPNENQIMRYDRMY